MKLFKSYTCSNVSFYIRFGKFYYLPRYLKVCEYRHLSVVRCLIKRMFVFLEHLYLLLKLRFVNPTLNKMVSEAYLLPFLHCQTTFYQNICHHVSKSVEKYFCARLKKVIRRIKPDDTYACFFYSFALY